MTEREIIDLARARWNETADEFNQWSELGCDEKLELVARAALASSDEQADSGKSEAVAQSAEQVELSPEFIDTSRAARAWVLLSYERQHADIDQAMRFALGMGAAEPLTELQVNEARRGCAVRDSVTPPAAPAQSVAIYQTRTVSMTADYWMDSAKEIFDACASNPNYEVRRIYTAPQPSQPAQSAVVLDDEPLWDHKGNVRHDAVDRLGEKRRAASPQATPTSEPRVNLETLAKLRTFLDAAGAEGFVIGGVDAGDLFMAIFDADDKVSDRLFSDEVRAIAFRELFEFQEATGCDTADEYRATATQPAQTRALTDGERKLIEAAAECISEAVTYEQDGFDSPPQPATQWDYNADQLAYALRGMLAAKPGTGGDHE